MEFKYPYSIPLQNINGDTLCSGSLSKIQQLSLLCVESVTKGSGESIQY